MPPPPLGSIKSWAHCRCEGTFSVHIKSAVQLIILLSDRNIVPNYGISLHREYYVGIFNIPIHAHRNITKPIQLLKLECSYRSDQYSKTVEQWAEATGDPLLVRLINLACWSGGNW